MIRNSVYPIRVVRGSVITVIGFPGSGKSTFVGRFLSGFVGPCLYVVMEEEAHRVTDRLNQMLTKDRQKGTIFVSDRCREDEIIERCKEKKIKHLAIDGILFIKKSSPISDPIGFMDSLNLHTLTMSVCTVKTGLTHARMDPILHQSDVIVRCGSEKRAWDRDLGMWTIEKYGHEYGKNVRGSIR